MQLLYLCCHLDGCKRRVAEGIYLVLLGPPASKDNFGLVKRGLEHPPFLVAMISQLTRTRPGIPSLSRPGSFFGGALHGP